MRVKISTENVKRESVKDATHLRVLNFQACEILGGDLKIFQMNDSDETESKFLFRMKFIRKKPARKKGNSLVGLNRISLERIFCRTPAFAIKLFTVRRAEIHSHE